ncbi:MAG: PEP-CTERM sorting domain-containing protein [Armatimonadetes bacterium]|nr:PEP-CTERM sorting domain-containing protein [Armatimonadota bacterium]
MKICSFFPAFRVGTLVAVALVATQVALATPHYEVVQIGNLPGTSKGNVVAINNNNVVAGNSFAGNEIQMFRWSEANGMSSSGFPHHDRIIANDINDAGQIVGLSYLGGMQGMRHEPGLMIGFAPAPGHVYSRGLGINNLGQMVGTSVTNQGVEMAARFPGGWGELLPNYGPQENSAARRINDAGDAVGHTDLAGTNRAALFRSNNTLVDLHAMLAGSIYSRAMDINDSGRIIGFTTNNASFTQGFLINFESGVTTIDPLSGHDFLYLDAINATGQIVGTSKRSSGSASDAVIWDSTLGLTPLNTLIDPNSGWELRQATGINNNGYIVGMGTFQGVETNFLLKPVPEPGTMLALGLGLVALARRKKTRV